MNHEQFSALTHLHYWHKQRKIVIIFKRGESNELTFTSEDFYSRRTGFIALMHCQCSI